jgi:hypothetical protein
MNRFRENAEHTVPSAISGSQSPRDECHALVKSDWRSNGKFFDTQRPMNFLKDTLQLHLRLVQIGYPRRRKFSVLPYLVWFCAIL